MERRQRRAFMDDYKRQAVDLVASSGCSVGSVAKELGLRDSVLRRWVEQRGAGREPTAALRRCGASGAAVGGSGGRGGPAAVRDRTTADGARHFKKLSSTVARLCRVETALCYRRRLEGSGRSTIGGTIPVKKHGPWVHANLRVVTSPGGDPD